MPGATAAEREVLPIHDRPYDGPVYEDAKGPNATFAPIVPLRPPPGAPNVLVVLLDDVGFGASSTFGGPCTTPTAERLAANGLKYNRFGGANGMIISQGGAFGGFVLYVNDGRPAYCYNLFGLQQFKVYGDEPIPAGEHQVRMEFAYDGGGLGKGGTVTLYVDGVQAGQGRVEGTVPMLFSADETTDVGSDTATPVSDDYGPTDSEFTCTVRWVQLDIDEAAEDADHLVSPEERFRIAMARQ